MTFEMICLQPAVFTRDQFDQISTTKHHIQNVEAKKKHKIAKILLERSLVCHNEI